LDDGGFFDCGTLRVHELSGHRARLQFVCVERFSASDLYCFEAGGFEVFEEEVLVVVLGFDGDDDFDALAAGGGFAVAV